VQMRRIFTSCLIAIGLVAGPGIALADGELNIFNWGDYTNPDLVKKFEKAYNVKVSVTDYDSNDTALAKIRAGGHGFDIVVPSAQFVPIWIKEGLLLETRPDRMDNFKNMDPKWVDVYFDPAAIIPCPGNGARPACSSTPSTTRAIPIPRPFSWIHRTI
jgi:spermidine/putrescine transport system substrate-binding protein